MGNPQDVYFENEFGGPSEVPAEVCKKTVDVCIKIETVSTSNTICLILGASIIFGALYYIYGRGDDRN